MIDAVPPGDLPELAMLAFKLELHHVQVCRAGRAAGAPTVGDVARCGCWRSQEDVTPRLSELVDKDTVSTLIQLADATGNVALRDKCDARGCVAVCRVLRCAIMPTF